jgi:hypothetical protein
MNSRRGKEIQTNGKQRVKKRQKRRRNKNKEDKMQQNTMKQKKRKNFVWRDVLNPNTF